MSRADEAGRAPPAVAAPKPLRQRHDGFTPKKQRRFFRTLGKTGCIIDACRKAGISRNTVRRHRNKWPAFEARVQEALAAAATELEAIAYRRATIGAEEKIYRDGRLVSIKVKPSDAMLRLLLQGANPKRYGRTAGERQANAATIRKLKAKLRDEVRREIHAEINEQAEERQAEVDAALRRNLAALRTRKERELLATGYQPAPPGYPRDGGLALVAPGWTLTCRDQGGG